MSKQDTVEKEALIALCNSLSIIHSTAPDMNANIPYTDCPACGTMDLYKHVPDLPKYHKPDCALVLARKIAFHE